MTPAEVEERCPVQPLFDATVPPPGPDFLLEAVRLGDPPLKVARARSKKKQDDEPAAEPERVWLTLLVRAALYQPGFALPVADANGNAFTAAHVPGHRWEHPGCGPAPADIMVVGNIPGMDELRTFNNFVGRSSEPLFQALDELKVDGTDYASWYVTNLFRFCNPDPRSGKKPVNWLKDGLHLLYQELRLVRPKFVLLLGAEAAKALMGKGCKVKEAAGKVAELSVPYWADVDGIPTRMEHRFKAMACLHPGQVVREPKDYHQFVSGLRLFLEMRGGTFGTGLDCARDYVRDAASLRAVVDRVLTETPAGAAIALDCEWDGRAHGDPASYLRTVQFSHRPGYACSIVVRLQFGAVNPDLDEATIRDELLRLCKSRPDRPVRVIGHNFKADLPWLLRLGVDLRDEFDAPADDPDADGKTEGRLFGWQKTRTQGGFDTMLAAHAYDESGPLGLEVLGATLLGLPRYDTAIDAFNAAYLKKHKMKKSDLTGYGHIPDFFDDTQTTGLLSYGADDADTTRRLFDLYNGVNGRPGLLDADRFGNSCRDQFHATQAEALVLAEMEANGLLIDRQRTAEAIRFYQSETASMLADFRAKYQWPDFNHQSDFHKREWLFGTGFSGKYDRETGQCIRVRPDDAISLNLDPVLDTDGRPWDEEESYDRKVGAVNAKADKTVMGILALVQGCAEVDDLRNLTMIGQTVKTILKPPVIDEDGEEVYEKGFLAFAGDDDRVRTTYGLAETGRLRSFKPNLQNVAGEGREEQFEKLLGDRYAYPLRGLFKARPGYVLVDADYSGAEVALAAWMSNDTVLMDHYRRNQLSPRDPDYYEIHCQNAVRTFKLACAATKEGLASVGRKGLRTAAKRTFFGSFYGQSAEGAALKANEEGANITTEEAEALLKFLTRQYSRLYGDYFPACRARVKKYGWLRTHGGRLRRFPETDDKARLAGMEREAQNAPIQGGVSDVVRQANINLHRYRAAAPHRHHFDLVLQVHDSIVAEVPVEEVEEYYDRTLQLCMVDGVPIFPADLDGRPRPGEGPYYLGVGKAVYLRWGEAITPEAGRAAGVPERFWKR